MVTDATMNDLPGLTQFHRLNLRDTRVTDAGIRRLRGLVQLQEIFIDGVQITDEVARPYPSVRQKKAINANIWIIAASGE